MITITLKDSRKTRVKIAKTGNSLKSFSEMIGISHPYLSQILNGKRNPSATVAQKITAGLDMRLEDVFLISNVAKDNPGRGVLIK